MIETKENKKSHERYGELLLIFTSLLFGLSFACQKEAMNKNTIGPITFSFFRLLISVLFLVCFYPCLQSIFKDNNDIEEKENLIDYNNDKDSEVLEYLERNIINNKIKIETINKNKKNNAWNYELFYWGVLVGAINFFGTILQQIGLVTVSAGRTGFITGSYVVIIPFIEYLTPCWDSKHLTKKTGIAAVVSFIGLYFLSGCIESEQCLGNELGYGELIVLISTFVWCLSILTSDIACKKVDNVALTLVEFIIPTVFSFILALIMESKYLNYQSIYDNWATILIVGIGDACGFLFSTVGQRYVRPSRTSILLSMESVNSVIFAYLIINEKLSFLEIVGSILMFLSTIISSNEINLKNCLYINNNNKNNIEYKSIQLIS
jgi:drug/metabolite transporter (DMT)-like permease